MYSVISLLILLSLDAITNLPVELQPPDGEYQKWLAYCDFDRFHDYFVNAKAYEVQGNYSSVNECESSCRFDEKCGMYVSGAEGFICFKYQHSANMWERAGLSLEDLFPEFQGFTIGSRQCRVETDHEECDRYLYTDGKYPASEEITYIYSGALLGDTECLRLCSMFTACKTMFYYQEYDHDQGVGGTFYCQLHSTTLEEGEKECKPHYPFCGTYTRYCTDRNSYLAYPPPLKI